LTGKVIGAKNETTQRITNAGEKENETVAVCYNAAGTLMPPFIVSPGKSLPKLPPGDEKLRVWRACSPKGWMDGGAMLEFLKFFRDELVGMGMLEKDNDSKKVY
jgi:hypothetical protein